MTKLLDYIKKIKAISEIGLTYSTNPYDIERYNQLKQLTVDIVSQISGHAPATISNLFLPDKGYATPKVDLRAGIFKDDKILLVRESSDGRWSLPGGWADVCESPTQGIIREVREETGIDVFDPQLAAVVDRSLHEYTPVYIDHIYKLFFYCKISKINTLNSFEILEAAFFSRLELPELSVDRILLRDIEHLFDFKSGHAALYVD